MTWVLLMWVVSSYGPEPQYMGQYSSRPACETAGTRIQIAGKNDIRAYVCIEVPK